MSGAVSESATATASPTRWRTLDIVVCAVIGVAFGVVFWAWDAIWGATAPVFDDIFRTHQN